MLRANGNYTVTYSRDTLETQESVTKGTFADQIFLNSETRFLDWGVLETEFFGISRTDGNKSIGATLNPSYIIFDKPQLRLGYLFSAANSDRNPPEYYAPQQYINHMLAKEVLRLAWYDKAATSAVLSISDDKNFEIRIDGKTAFSAPLLAEPRPTLETLITMRPGRAPGMAHGFQGVPHSCRARRRHLAGRSRVAALL